jgi:hypothetical protein
MVASVESNNKAWRGPHGIQHLGRVGLKECMVYDLSLDWTSLQHRGGM